MEVRKNSQPLLEALLRDVNSEADFKIRILGADLIDVDNPRETALCDAIMRLLGKHR